MVAQKRNLTKPFQYSLKEQLANLSKKLQDILQESSILVGVTFANVCDGALSCCRSKEVGMCGRVCASYIIMEGQGPRSRHHTRV